MPLKPCRECKEPVSTSAKSCPKCGTPKPTQKKSVAAIGCLSIILLVAIISMMTSGEEKKVQEKLVADRETKRATDSARVSALAARTDLTSDSAKRADDEYHTLGLNTPHDQVHSQAAGVLLDSAEILMGNAGSHPDLDGARRAVTAVRDPLSPQDAERKASIATAIATALEREAAESEARGKEALEQFIRVRDDVQGITRYYPRWAGQYVNGHSAVLLSLAKPDHGAPSLIFSIRYVADDWLFIERYVIKADDQKFVIPTRFGDVEKDNAGGEIWEWWTSAYDARAAAIVGGILASKGAVIRHEGKQYHKDREIGAQERADLQRMLDAYAVLRKSP